MMGSTLKFLGGVLCLAGAAFTGFSLLGFPQSDPGYGKLLRSLILVSGGLAVIGLGEILLVLQRFLQGKTQRHPGPE